MVRLRLTSEEVALIQDIEFVGHGELYDVKINPGEQETAWELPPEHAELIKELRLDSLDRVVIHDGIARYGERHEVTPSGRHCLLKKKF